MSIIDGLFAGRAGIQSHGTAIAVLADNIANQNTVGFKQSRPDFADLLAGTLNGSSANATGSGSQVLSITPILTQGTFESTGRGLDVGIDGNGFFVVENESGSGQRYYTRAGNFHTDTSGNLLDQNGYQVMGFKANGSGGLEALNVNEFSDSSVATGTLTVSGNLGASTNTVTGGVAGIPDMNPAAPATPPTFAELNAAAQFSNFTNVYDSLGATHTLTTFFYHTDSNEWYARTVVDGGDVTGGTKGMPVQVGADVELTFNTDGSRSNTPATGTPDVTLTPAWKNGSATGAIKLTYEPFTQTSSSSGITSVAQDGSGAGNVVGFKIESDGSLYAQLDNGQTATIGQIALAVFPGAEGLARVGNSLFSQTAKSGEPVVGTPNSGAFGKLQAGSLELSTADLAADFVKLISLQRGFQGSSRIITQINDLLQEVIRLAG